MNSSRRHQHPKAIVRRLCGSTLALVLAATGATAQAGDSAAPAPQLESATERVAAALADDIDSMVSAKARRDFVTSSHVNTLAEADSAQADRPAPRSSEFAASARAVEHTRLYIAIKDGAADGVLVQ